MNEECRGSWEEVSDDYHAFEQLRRKRALERECGEQAWGTKTSAFKTNAGNSQASYHLNHYLKNWMSMATLQLQCSNTWVLDYLD